MSLTPRSREPETGCQRVDCAELHTLEGLPGVSAGFGVTDGPGLFEGPGGSHSGVLRPTRLLIRQHRSDQQDDRFPVGEDPDHVGASTDLRVQQLVGAARPDPAPELLREGGEGQNLLPGLSELISTPRQLGLQRCETRNVELQESMVPMREAISPDGWEATGRLQEARSADGATGFDAYAVQLSYRLDRALDDSEFDQVARLLDDAGWEQNDSPMTSDAEFEHPDGAEVDLITGEDHLVISLESPAWWGDEDVLRDPPDERDGPLTTEDRDQVMREEPTCAVDAWPEAP